MKPVYRMILCAVLAHGAVVSAATPFKLGTFDAEWKKSRDEFLRLFYGPLAIVEDRDVESAMIIFKSYIDNENRCRMAGGNPENLSLALAHACRQSLGESWGYSFEQLKGRYQELASIYWDKYNALLESQQTTKS